MRNLVHAEGHSSFVHTPKRLLAAIVLCSAAAVMPQLAGAQSGERSGKEVVEAVCAACHATGAKGSPKIGDQKAWAKLAARGLSSLTASALKGIRNMPSHGGNPSLTDNEIERAITYMVNQSGGHWTEPISRTPEERKGEQVVKSQCAKCHEAGVGGAPKIGDRAAWIPRLKQGMDFLVRSAINGHGGMPPRGGMANLTDAEVQSAIVYMVNGGSVPAAKAASAAPAAAVDPNHKIIAGTEIYLGVVSAESMRAQYPKGSPESAMHGGIPSGRGYYHVNISLLDSKTKAVITDAQVEAKVAEPTGGETKKLELVTLNNTKSYGNYFRMPSKNPYTITVQIQRPGAARPIVARFDYRHY